MYRYFRPLLFRLDPESAHSLIINLLRIAGFTPGLRQIILAAYQAPDKPVDVFGLRFKNPIGLAAGYDKDGIGWRGLSLLGFGHIEIGTVTPKPQSGNPRPRMFRLTDDEALINQLGFPGRGSHYVEKNISKFRPVEIKLGVNLGKNAATPLISALEDYKYLIKRFNGLADYLVINISSPNTQGLRRLQARNELDKFLKGLTIVSQEEEKRIQAKTPILIKISPDLSDNELEDALDIIIEYGIDGIIATNTTINREHVDPRYSHYAGGLSGKPLASRSTEMIRMISDYTAGKLPIIGVGGVMGASDARTKLDEGANLVQIYTGLVYRGPGLVKRIIEALPD
jgi:dihydroorotate dehydrogenase